MINYLEGDVYLTDDVNIIFNPVGVRDSTGFSNKVKILYPGVYTEYKEKVWMYNIKELLGDIQLVYVEDNKFVLNGFCKTRLGHIDKLALCKTLIELCNLAQEYKLSVGIEHSLGIKDKAEKKLIDTIIELVFDKSDTNINIYKRKITKHKRKGKKPPCLADLS